MNINRILLKGINHQQWVSIEYKNKDDQITKYWIGIKDFTYRLDTNGEIKTIIVCDLFNVTKDNVVHDATIYLDRILRAKAVEGTFFECPLDILDKIKENEAMTSSFVDSFDDRILDYFEDCYKLDNTPYISNYAQILGIDQDNLMEEEKYFLNSSQFKTLVNKFTYKEDSEKKVVDTLAMNVVSIHFEKGLFVLAYRPLILDIEKKALIPSKNIILNKSFIMKDKDITLEVSARKFLDEEDYALLDNINTSKEEICDAISKNVKASDVDDSPHILSLGRDFLINMNREYAGIRLAHEENRLSYPLRSFFGQVVEKPGRTTTYPICLASEANLDQMLVIYQALKYPVTFVQGPPGTGKTKTISNLLVNCLFNNKTVLVSTNNNVPLDGLLNTLKKLKYRNSESILFPVLRLGNDEVIKNTLNEIPIMLNKALSINSIDDRIQAVKERYTSKKKELKEFLEKYAEKVDLEERLATLNDQNIKDAFSLRSYEIVDPQIDKIQERLQKYADINEDNLIVKNTKEIDNDILMYLYFDSANRIKKLQSDLYAELRNILYTEDEDEKLAAFKHYIEKDENLENLLSVFPIIFTTNMSSYKLGEPKEHFDLVVMDEAGQCNAAISLVPILRGKSLLLVGDTCQLKPVIVLDPINNNELKLKYHINDTYDYIENSILKMFYTNDTISNMILLKNHYRCDPKIIGFNNQKFYNKKLSIKSSSKCDNPLLFIDCPNAKWNKKNTSMNEANLIINYCKENPNTKIGIITPFVNQKNLINEQLKNEGIADNVSCGTIHEFQGDEKDTIIFSTAITDKTSEGTYSWLMNNKELFNVATSRAKDQLIVLGNEASIQKLHQDDNDIFYELYKYIKSNGEMEVSFLKDVGNRALDVKPFSSELEKAFLDNLIQVIECNYASTIVYRKEVAAASIFNPKLTEKESSYFYSCRFDFVLFDKNNDYPLLAIELCGPEHQNNEIVIARDKKKKEICKNHNFELIMIDNAYARRYGQLKQSLLSKLFKENKKESNTDVPVLKVKEEQIHKDVDEIAEKQKKEEARIIRIITDFFSNYEKLIHDNKIKDAYGLLQNNSIKEIDSIVKDMLKSEFKKGLFKSIKYIGNKNECNASYYISQYKYNKLIANH